jgi:hypothetical protein
LVRLVTQASPAATYFLQVNMVPAVRSSSGAQGVSASLRPIYVADANDALRYRLSVVAPATSSEVAAVLSAGSVVAVRSGSTWHVDLTYGQLNDGLRNGIQIRVKTGTRQLTRRLTLGARVARLDLTTGDPYQIWPPIVCGATAKACVASLPADLGQCGSYREVSRCVAQVECERTSSFETIPSAELDAATVQYNALASTGGQWARIDSLRAFELSGCRQFSLKDVVEGAVYVSQEPAVFEVGEVINEQQTVDSTVFGTLYSSGGPALYRAVSEFGTAPAQVWRSIEQRSCQNCSEFGDRMVLFFESSRRVVIIEGIHGYDS